MDVPLPVVRISTFSFPYPDLTRLCTQFIFLPRQAIVAIRLVYLLASGNIFHSVSADSMGFGPNHSFRQRVVGWHSCTGSLKGFDPIRRYQL